MVDDITDEFDPDPPVRTGKAGRIARGLKQGPRVLQNFHEKQRRKPLWKKQLAGRLKADTQQRNKTR